jgi:hypothetical protein
VNLLVDRRARVPDLHIMRALGCSGGSREERSPSECDSLRLSTARENAKEHKHNKDDHDDPDDSADRKEHSERCEHSRLLVSVSVSSLLAGLQNESSRGRRRSAARAEAVNRFSFAGFLAFAPDHVRAASG